MLSEEKHWKWINLSSSWKHSVSIWNVVLLIGFQEGAFQIAFYSSSYLSWLWVVTIAEEAGRAEQAQSKKPRKWYLKPNIKHPVWLDTDLYNSPFPIFALL